MSNVGGTFKKRNSSSVLLYGGRIALILSPVLLLLIQSFILKTNLFKSVPVWSDELDYWREMFSFSNCGFNFGGSLFVGHDAKIGPFGAHSFSPLAAWGIFFPVFRSAFAPYAILWINLFMLCAAWFIFVYLIKPDIKITYVALISALIYPLNVLYTHSSMIELPALAGIIVYFSILYKWEEEEDKGKWFVWLMIVGIWCICVRITYIVILFPAIWKKTKFKFNLRSILAILAYFLGFLGFYKFYNLFCADYPGWVTEKISEVEGIKGKLSVIFYNGKDNLKNFFSPTSADSAQVGMRYFFFILLLFGIGAAVRNAKIKSKVNLLYISLSVMMGGLLVMMLGLYDIKEWRDFRTFAPIVFGVFLFLVLGERNDLLNRIFLYSFMIFVSMMCFTSGVNFAKDKGVTEVKDLSSYFADLETMDENGEPRTVGSDMINNWCDVSIMNSLPAKLGYQIFYGDLTEDEVHKVDYCFVSRETYLSDMGLFAGYESFEIPGYGMMIKMFN